jgi:AraC-like DNA-binding protein
MAINATARDCASLHFSTRELAPAKRLGALRDLFERSVQLELDAEPGHPVEMTMHLTPGLRRARMLSSFTAQVTRPAPMLADGEDTVCLMMKTGGHMALRQGRQEGVPNLGDAVLLVYREPARLEFVDATYVSVRVPFAALSMLGGNVGAAAGRRIPGDSQALSLLRSYVGTMPEAFTDPALARLAATHVYDLIAMAIGAPGEGGALAHRPSVRAARLEAIKADLTRDATIGIAESAARHAISPRYIQMLFEEAGTTFSEFVLERRLDAARAMLVSPRYTAWSIATIALEAGFGDLSHFNRRFKQRYAMTPRELRAQMRAHDAGN